MKKTLTALIVLVLFGSVVFDVQPVLVNANFLYNLPEITIKSDGTVEPETQYITCTGNVYTLTKNLTRAYVVVIKCSNIVFDGAGYVIDGSQEYLNGPSYMNTGLILQNVTNVTIKDIAVLGFGVGWKQIEVNDCYDCSFIGVSSNGVMSGGGFNRFSECILSLIVQGSKSNVIYKSNISLGLQSSSVVAFGNNLLAAISGDDDSVWDDGFVGNYWHDYLTRYPGASEIGDTGIGDTPYVIDANNVDHCPLMYPYVVSKVEVDCAKNDSYTDGFALNFTVNKPTSWIGYSLDGAGNVTVSGNTTITGLSGGVHAVTVYVRDVYGFEAASNTITFTTTAETGSFPILQVSVTVALLSVIAVGFVLWKKSTDK